MTDQEIKRKKLNENIEAMHKLIEKLETNRKIFPVDYQGPLSDDDISSDDSLMQETEQNTLSNLQVSNLEGGDSSLVKEIAHPTTSESLLRTLLSEAVSLETSNEQSVIHM